MLEIAGMGEILTGKIFDIIEAFALEDNWDKSVDKAPISTVIGQIGKNRWDPGYRMRLTRIFKDCNITTVGELLRIGSHDFRKVRNIGNGAISRIDEALEELYNIKSW